MTGRFGSNFNLSLLNEDTKLKPGKYILMIDPLWHDSTKLSGSYKDILVDIQAPKHVMIDQLDDLAGFEVMAKALKHHALTRSPEKAREHYLADNPDYGKDVMRVQDIESLPCWYGFIYTKNSSAKLLHETMRPDFTGLTVIYPLQTNKEEEGQPVEIEFKLESGEDHIVILRRA